MYKLKEGKEYCKMLYIGCVVAVVFMNLQFMFLFLQDYYKNKIVKFLLWMREEFLQLYFQWMIFCQLIDFGLKEELFFFGSIDNGRLFVYILVYDYIFMYIRII